MRCIITINGKGLAFFYIYMGRNCSNLEFDIEECCIVGGPTRQLTNYSKIDVSRYKEIQYVFSI